jgi:uncharacterized Zn-finger protein
MALEILAATSHIMSENLMELRCFDVYSPNKSKSFRCEEDGCFREFTSKRNLVDHCRGHHQGKKPHVCQAPGCGKSFLRPAHLLIHTRIHTGEKPFVCTYEGCGKRWNQKSALKQHLRSHTGEKPFVCTVDSCDKSFSTSSSCKRHILTHGHQNSKLNLLLLQSKKRERVDAVDELPTKQPTKRVCDRMEITPVPQTPVTTIQQTPVVATPLEIPPMAVTPLELKIVEEVMIDLEIPVIDPKKMTLGFILN